MTDLDERWQRVGVAVRDRMRELGLNQKDVTAASGISAETIRPIRQGRPGNYSAKTKSRVAMALSWRPDSIDRILDGDDPVPVERGDPDAGLYLTPDEAKEFKVALGKASELVSAIDYLIETTHAMRARIKELEDQRDPEASDPSAPPR